MRTGCRIAQYYGAGRSNYRAEGLELAAAFMRCRRDALQAHAAPWKGARASVQVIG
jgi:hypothetical protein